MSEFVASDEHSPFAASSSGDDSSPFVASSSHSPFAVGDTGSPFAASSGDTSPFAAANSNHSPFVADRVSDSPFVAANSSENSPFTVSNSHSPFVAATEDSSPFVASSGAGAGATESPFVASSGSRPFASCSSGSPFAASTGNTDSPFAASSGASDISPFVSQGSGGPFSTADSSPFVSSGTGRRDSDDNDPFHARGANDDPFHARGTSTDESPFRAARSTSNDDSPFRARPRNDNSPSRARPRNDDDIPFRARRRSNDDDPFRAGGRNGPFAAVAAEEDNPFVARVEHGPFGGTAGGNNGNNDGLANLLAGGAARDPFAARQQEDNNNPFVAGGANDNPFAVGGANDNPFAAQPDNNPFVAGGENGPFGGGGGGGGLADFLAGGGAGANPFGGAGGDVFGGGAAAAAGGGVNGALLEMFDTSQNSIGENFLANHMIRLSEQTCMILSEDERRWTKELKAAFEARKDLTPVSDMLLAQCAIICDGNVMDALITLQGLQAFRKCYGVDDTKEQGLECLRELMDQQEGMLLDVDTNPQTQESVAVVDMRSFNPALALAHNKKEGPEYNWKVLIRGLYYLNRACQPSLASIRHGLQLVMDCDGIGWENFHLEVDQRMHAELLQHYPLKWKKIQAYNTGMVSNVWWGLVKRLCNDNFKECLELGCRLVDTDASRPPRRLAEMYRQPSLQAVRQKVLRRVQELLDTRENNEEEFDLATAPPMATVS